MAEPQLGMRYQGLHLIMALPSSSGMTMQK